MERLISPDRALELVLANTPVPRAVPCRIQDARGRTLAQEIVAPEDYPRFPRAMMDGFAVAVSDAGATIEVVGEVAAGHASRHRVAPGKCVEIMTGAWCPPGTEAVVMVERVKREGARIVLPESIEPGQHVQRVGELCTKGTRTLGPGVRISPLVLAHLHALNQVQVMLYALPSVAIVSTGDELVASGEALREGQIRDSNGPMLVAQTQELGVTEVTLLHARDTQQSLTETLAMASKADVVVLTGGVSMGRYDLVPQVVGAMGTETLFHKVTQKPGKPLLFAAGAGRLLFGLPGNARSSHFCFDRYVAPALRAWSGRPPLRAPCLGRLTRPYGARCERTLFVPMLAESADDGWSLTPFDEHGSADIYSPVRGNVYARFEAGEHALPAGSTHSFSWIGDGHG